MYKVFVLILALAFCNCSYLKSLFLQPNKSNITYIRDDLGRIIIYHGLNVSNYAKHSDGGKAGLTWHEKKDFDRATDEWGFNLIRYLFFWEAFEPIENLYNDSYYKATIEKIQEIKSDVILDVHQDIYSQKFSGDGFPAWTIHDGGKKFTLRQPWSLNYLEQPVIDSYTYFWKDSILQDKYLKMLKRVMVMVDSLPNVIGVDVMNEPFPGLTLHFEEKCLTNFYNKIQNMAHEMNFKKKIFFEPWMYTSGGLPTKLKFKPDSNCIYVPHYYDPFCHEGGPYKDVNQSLMIRLLKNKVAEAEIFKVPMTLGEFGISPRVPNYLNYLRDALNITDQYCFGWTYYGFDRTSSDEFGIINDSLQEMPNMQWLVRVYPQKIAGDNPSYSYDKNHFTLEFDAKGNSPSQIFIPNKFKNIVIKVDNKIIDKQVIGTTYLLNTIAGHRKVDITWE
jgi:endoglycosylceramidase